MAYKKKADKGFIIHGKQEKLSALVLIGSLKASPYVSSTEALARLVRSALQKHNVRTEFVRLADYEVKAGTGHYMGKGDDWPEIEGKIKAADIIIFATPIWWGSISSLMQRAIERMDALDEDYTKTGRSALLNKVAGYVVNGSEDGALHSIGLMMSAMHWLEFTHPPECATYWVGEVGQDTSKDRQRMLRNKSTRTMASRMARNLAFYAQLLKQHPLREK